MIMKRGLTQCLSLVQPIPQEAVTDPGSLVLGVFFGLMLVMGLYNLVLYFSLRDKAYLLYVAVVFFNILTTLAINGLGEEYFWTESPGLDDQIYITFAGISMAFSSRFAAVFLRLKETHKRLNQLMWLLVALSLLMTLLSLVLPLNQFIGFARWLVLLSFPLYIVSGFVIYRRGFKPALFYIIAWLPYILGIIIRTLHGADWFPDSPWVYYSVEAGGALELVLLSFALADRIRSMRKELTEKELEKEQFKTKLLQDQKEVLEKTVDERTKELREANATKDKFFSIIAHDLRSPMIGLQGVGQKLEYFIRKERPEKLLEMGRKIDQSIDQLNHLLNNLLNWATSQIGGVPHHPDQTDLVALVNENIELYKSLAESKEVSVTNDIEILSAHVDANAISTVIRNLLSNAIKFSPNGGKVLISGHESDDFSQITISDEGEGMDKSRLKSLFTADLKSSRGTDREKGFGLGLKLCKEFVEQNRGEIAVQSTPGQGTTFTISLPANAQGLLHKTDVA